MCNLGELHCALCYNDTLHRLTISIDEARNLGGGDLFAGCGNGIIFFQK